MDRQIDPGPEPFPEPPPVPEPKPAPGPPPDPDPEPCPGPLPAPQPVTRIGGLARCGKVAAWGFIQEGPATAERRLLCI